MAIISSIAAWLLKKRIHEIELYKMYPHNVQFDCFEKLIHSAEETEWGRAHDYVNITSVVEFRKKVAISSYHDIEHQINRMREGEENILWPGVIEWYAKSSGTTSAKSKFIPVSDESLQDCHFKGGKDLLAVYHDEYSDSEFLSGKTIGIAGSIEQDEVSGSYTGDLSAILMSNLPIWAHFSKAPRLGIVVMDEWTEKLEKIVEHTIDEDIRSISGVPSWMLVILRRVLEVSGKDRIKDVWPNFELVLHGGVSFTPYRKQFEEICGPDVHYQEVYNASEGFFAMQDDFQKDDMLLMLDNGVFYEFLPMEELNSDSPKAIDLIDVEIGKTYALVISTNAGLWRYLIGDTVVFTETKPYRIKINGRTKSFINAVGEEVIVDNAEQAILHACKYTDAVVSEYTAAPIFFSDDEKASHEWLIEFDKEPSDMGVFSELLDNGLKMVNSDYEAKRYRNMVLTQPVVHHLPKGSFIKWLDKNGRMGGQYKVPRLSNDRKIVEEVMELINK